MHLSTIDPILPALAHCFDLPAIAQGFTANLPAGAGQSLCTQGSTNRCAAWQVPRLQHLHYQPGHHCIATYELSWTQSGQPPLTTIGVVEYTPTGFHYRCFHPDPDLPGLATALDGQVMANRLATLTQPGRPAARPEPCTVTPIRYRPGQRCALRYTIQQPTGTHGFFGKLFHHADQQRMAALPALYALGEMAPERPRLPQPLAYWPDLQLLIQPIIDGAEFHERVFAEATPAQERVDWFQRLGVALAALHRVTDQTLPHRPLATDLAELAAYTPIIDQVRPAVAPVYAATLQALTRAAQSLTAVPPVVCHGALRTDQWLITRAPTPSGPPEQLMLIDLDTLCLANPACDLSNCLAYLAWKALRQPHHAPFIRTAEAAFLAGYAVMQPLPPAEWLALYRAVTLLKIAGRRFRSLTYREWALTPQLIQAAQTIVETTLQEYHDASAYEHVSTT